MTLYISELRATKQAMEVGDFDFEETVRTSFQNSAAVPRIYTILTALVC